MNYIYKVKRLSKMKFVKDTGDAYKISPKIKDFEVKSIIIYNRNIISCLIEKNYLFKFKKILELMKVSDTDDSDERVLVQIDLLEWLILNEYRNFLSLEELKVMLKDVYFIKHNLLNKNIVLSVGKSR